jgi:DNA polymerase-3 subunit beta
MDARGEISVIVPGRAMNELSRILSNDENEKAYVRAAHNHILFQVGGITLTSRLIDGQFPNFERVVPKEHERMLTIPTDDLQNAIRRASIVARENSNRVIFKTSGEQVIITAESGDIGKAYEEVDVVREGDDIEIAFNARYLLDVLNVLGSDGLYLELTTPLKQGLIRPTEGSDYRYVIMPMQLT